jgi:hypothetical protein
MLSKASGACVAITMYMAVMIVGLAAVAGHQGKLAPVIHIWPDADAYDHLWHSSPLRAARGILGSLGACGRCLEQHGIMCDVLLQLRMTVQVLLQLRMTVQVLLQLLCNAKMSTRTGSSHTVDT